MSHQSKRRNYWRKIPIVGALLKKWDFYKTAQNLLKWHQNERDSQELERTIPPKSENIELHCAWVSEAYGPSEVDSLINNLKEMGWDRPERNIGSKESLTAWIRRARNSSLGSSWRNGGIILSHSDDGELLGADIRRTKLPNGVDYGYLTLRNVTSSLTLVTIQFVFDDETGSSLNKLFNDSYRTKVKYRSSFLKSKGATYIGAVEQKRQAIKNELDNIHANLHKWFNKNLPGYFAAVDRNNFPTVDLITSRSYEQQSEDMDKLQEHHTDLIFDYGVESWKCKTDKNLELRLSWRGTKIPSAVIFGNYEKLTEGNETYGGKNRDGLANKLHTTFDRTMTLLTTHNLLLSYERQLSAIRDRISFKIKRTRDAIKNLNFIKQYFLSISTDIQIVGNDIAELSKAKNRYTHDVLDFAPPFYKKTGENIYPNFIELLRQQTEMRTEQLSNLEYRVNKAIAASGNLISAIANLRIQRIVFWFTVFTAILTLVSIFR